MPPKLHFRISSALKDIIGKDLITDDYVAVFELVKNAYDAYATSVDIFFENIYSSNPTITIKDNGKGMDFEDIKNKWLFVAYSAKKEGTEDDSFDYRDKIYKNRPFAGAKGIGRFSCDRLGKKLYLETKKKKEGAKVEVLITNWESFEEDLKDEFVNIQVEHKRIAESQYGLRHGTVLEISDLRSKWNRTDFLKLKDSLAKLINPSQGKGEQKFKINLHVPEEAEKDYYEKEYYNVVNGEIKNFIFETLELKTTKIYSSISEDGKTITTELRDGNTLIYKIKEKNNFELLQNIDYTIFYLNRAAKMNFALKMGIASVNYGHIFLYKNGFRIYPYGQPGMDPLKIDVRKAQGQRRHLGTRELVGKIEIFFDTDQLKEVTSRGNGLIKTPTSDQLEECFREVLKRLEKYVVDVQQWGLSIEDEDTFQLKTRASDLIARLTESNALIDFEVKDNFFEILEASQINSAETIVKALNRLAMGRDDAELSAHAEKASQKLAELQLAKEEAERVAAEEQRKALEATKKLKDQISENLFLKSISTTEFQEVISLLHHIGIYAGTVDNNLKGISLRVQNEIPLSNDELYDIIRLLSFETKKILNIVSFATKANFKLKTEEIEVQLTDYVREYIQNIIPTTTDKLLSIEVSVKTDKQYIKKVKPIELNIVIDNIISNARKAGADKLRVIFDESAKNKLRISFVDNGTGIKEEHLKRLYDFGFTTTDGSGIGLYHVRDIIKSLGGSIQAKNNEIKGATFTIEF